MVVHELHSSGRSRHRLVAVLGPTNTGKTHLAVERMLGHRSGIIGLPLRLLAREIYDRVAAARGAAAVALVTGEEKIQPANPAYTVCTVEAMPMGLEVDFLAVDEIQLCQDLERGHVFTDRLLRARGRVETMFLGADTIRPLIAKLLPDTEFISRPRFSELRFTGYKKLSRLPRRSVIVAFSSDDVYTIAELVRRQRGGAAVVLGALSPRTRNAQVALYQAGEVDYLVATDAIGMGLNMDVDHVAFAGLTKFDGRFRRPLSAAEIGQIAGRAGRHMNDGGFGLTGVVKSLEAETVEKVVNHRFDPAEHIQWRNAALEFSSLPALLASLQKSPPQRLLVQARDADDLIALRILARQRDVAARASGAAAIRRLWEVCRVPDFRKTMADNHHALLRQLYLQLSGERAVIDEDWLAPMVERLDRTEGDVDTLANRIAHVRTLTYIANRPDWLDDPGHWRERTRDLEDRLSDALHAALTHRFVDRRTAALHRKLSAKRDLFGAVTANGEVLVEGQYVGRLLGLRFIVDAAARGADERPIRAAANRVLAREIERAAAALADAGDEEITWREDNSLHWRGAAVARLAPGAEILKPRVALLPVDHLSGPLRERVRLRLARWLSERLAGHLGALYKLQGLDLAAPGRGIVYQLLEGLGVLSRRRVAELLAALSGQDRHAMARAGIRLGYVDIFVPAILKPERAAVCARLWAVQQEREQTPRPPAPGLVTFSLTQIEDAAVLPACGFRRFGGRALRVDIADRLARMAHERAKGGAFVPDHEMASLAGCGHDDLAVILKGLGYARRRVGERQGFVFKPPARERVERPERGARTGAFDALAGLNRAKDG